MAASLILACKSNGPSAGEQLRPSWDVPAGLYLARISKEAELKSFPDSR